MKLYLEKETDTRRVRILKRVAFKLHEEIRDLVAGPLREQHEWLLAQDLRKLNERIARAEGDKPETYQLPLFDADAGSEV